MADDGVHGPELWKSDGTETGTGLVQDIRPGPNGSSFSWQLTELEGSVLFQADDGTHGTELWRSDGTEDGTYLLNDLQPGSGSSYPRIIGRAGGLVYFTATYGPYYYDSVLLTSDGTPGSAAFVTELTRLYGATGVEYAGAFYFTARSWSSALELWKSDGTAGGTVLVREFPVLPNHGDVGGISEFTEFQRLLYFMVSDGDNDRVQLWRMQRNGLNMTHVKDLDAGSNGFHFCPSISRS